MGEIIVRKVRGMNWKAKISLVLIFTLVIIFAALNGAQAATRFYLQNANSAVTTTNQGAWSYTTGAPTLVMSTAKSGTITSRAVSETNNTNTYDVMILKFVSAPIPAQTIAAGSTLTWAIGAQESSTAANDYWTIHAYVVSNNGATIRGTLLSNNQENTTNEWPTTAQGWGPQAAKSLTAVTAQANDRIVIEIGYIARNTSTTSYTGTLWYGGTGSDLTVAGDETTLTGWFEFSGVDATPPNAGTVNVSPTSSTYTSGSPTITTVFTDSESAVTSCEYTTNNGTNWYAGVVSGSSPNYTCTANPTGLTGSLTINMRATSTGGTGTATAITRTVDTTGPTTGTLTVTAGLEQNVLSWTASTDAGSGLRTGSIYDVRFLAGATPPGCTTGTSVYTGDLLTFTHTGLSGNQQYSYRVCAYDNVSNASAGATGTSGLVKWGSTITSCDRCHAYPPLDGTRDGATGAVVGDHQLHLYVCSTCHVAPGATDYAHRTGNIQMQASISGGTYSRGTSFAQSNNAIPQTGTCSNVSCHGGTGTTTPQWGVGTVGCVDCHAIAVSSPTAQGLGGPATRDAVVGEFGLAWGHKKTGRGAVTNSDCIVCHLEGNFSTQHTSSYHMDGYIDLRDPDGAGETEITNISGATFRFVQFSTSYAAGSRTSTGQTSNNTDNVLTQKFCLACHDSNGAANLTARSTYGTPTQYMPFGGVNLGANYTVANGAAAVGGLVNVKDQLASTNSSWHPVRQPKNRDFPINTARLNDPYKYSGTRSSGNPTLSVVLNCFDCHNVSGASPLTTRTVAAHGNAETVRGIVTISGSPGTANKVTLCVVCHAGYDTSTAANHSSGSAFSANGNGGMTNYLRYGCNVCHGSDYATAVVRPVRAMDVHGVDVLPTGGTTPDGRWATDPRPYAFIRNNHELQDHQPRVAGGTTYSPQCSLSSGGPTCSNQGSGLGYTVGGTY
ncbi:MAG: CxxxxCH/CxxCH domain-containing protein [Nitrospiraceae bacterium]|nr:CxxxxCH/CxxCH domain-containing protein [Nitrospiraceae bacterium]